RNPGLPRPADHDPGLARPDRRPERDRERRSVPLLRPPPEERRRLLLRLADLRRRRLRVPAFREPVAHGPRLALAARRLARRRGDEHAGELAEAARDRG